jgi:predicted transcriptional regulator
VADTKKSYGFYLPAELVQWVNMQADAERRPRSYIVERALTRERAALEAAARDEP